MRAIHFLLLPLFNWEKVDGLEFEDLALLYLPHVWSKHLEGLVGAHWEPMNVIRGCRAILLMSQT